MDNQKLLYKIIKKARKNRPDLISEGTMDCDVENSEYWKVIFTKEFAIAYWGNIYTRQQPCNSCRYMTFSDAWRVYQHKMLDEVQAGRNPLKYLEKFL